VQYECLSCSEFNLFNNRHSTVLYSSVLLVPEQPVSHTYVIGVYRISKRTGGIGIDPEGFHRNEYQVLEYTWVLLCLNVAVVLYIQKIHSFLIHKVSVRVFLALS
jgi:hypothetical protein